MAGTTFHLWLPASQAVHAAACARAVSRPSRLMQGRVLFMDDEEPIRLMASILLARLGLEAVTAADGDEAVRLFEQARDEGRPFNVVVMDLTVPGGMGGLQAMQADASDRSSSAGHRLERLFERSGDGELIGRTGSWAWWRSLIASRISPPPCEPCCRNRPDPSTTRAGYLPGAGRWIDYGHETQTLAHRGAGDGGVGWRRR
jgi:hypothetical protein